MEPLSCIFVSRRHPSSAHIAWHEVQHMILLSALLMMMMMTTAPFPGYAAQTDMSCHEANSTCYLKEECRVRMELLQATCGPYGQYCSLPQPKENDLPGQSYVEYCRSALISIKKLEPNFRCYCTLALSSAEYSTCIAVWRFLEQHPCVENPQWNTSKPNQSNNRFIPNRLEPTFATQPNIDETIGESHTTTQIIVVQPPRPPTDNNDCLVVEKQCHERSLCKVASSNFRLTCRGSKSQCLLNKMKCVSAYENVRRFGVFACTCQQNHPSTHACSTILRSYQQNACLELFESQTISGRSAVEPKREKPTKTNLQIQKSNCYNVFQECTRSTTCLVQMLRLTEDCKWNESGDVCINYAKCQKALSTFYTSEEHVFGMSALHCECPDKLPACLHQRELFRPRCAHRDRTTPSCLQLHSMCRMNTKHCLERLTLYYRMCSVDQESGLCTYSQAECHQRRRYIWGTVLTLNCTCEMSKSDDPQLAKRGFRKTCKEIQNRLTKPPCLERERWSNVEQQPSLEKVDRQEEEVCSLVEEKEARFYYNGTCSRLCTCSRTEDKVIVHNCRQLYCAKQAGSSCAWFESSVNCHCVDGSILCTTKANNFAQNSGLFLNVAYSLAEYQDINEHAADPVDMDQMATSLTKLLNRLTGRQHCTIVVAWENTTQGQVVFGVHPRQQKQHSPIGSTKQILPLCDYSMNLLKLVIASQDPHIVHHPYLSLFKVVQVFRSGRNNAFNRSDSIQSLATPINHETNVGGMTLSRDYKSDVISVGPASPKLVFLIAFALCLELLN